MCMGVEPANVGTVGERIRMARAERGLTLRDVASTIHVSHALVRRWENDEVYPRLDEAEAVCAALDIPIAWLIEGLGARPVSQAIGLPEGFKTENR